MHRYICFFSDAFQVTQAHDHTQETRGMRDGNPKNAACISVPTMHQAIKAGVVTNIVKYDNQEEARSDRRQRECRLQQQCKKSSRKVPRQGKACSTTFMKDE